jgi:uncharacterized membrane protein YraQ (UPF0718 family)
MMADGAADVAATTALGVPPGITEMGPGALLILVVATFITAMLRGWIVPRVHYDTVVAMMNTWKSTAEKALETNAVQARTIDKQTAVGDTVVRVMSSVQDAAQDGDSS